MKTIWLAFAFSMLSFYAISQNDTIRNFKNDSTTILRGYLKPKQQPINYSLATSVLNGQHTIYNKQRQISKEGIFKDNRFIEGKNYKYNDDGTLNHVELYKDGVMVGTAPK
jgi:antitoxin component YwqK of YwqJK toxin-antitoxin module